VHDPTLFADGGTFYVFSTGRLDALDPGGIFARRSTCGRPGLVPRVRLVLDRDQDAALGRRHAHAGSTPHVVGQQPPGSAECDRDRLYAVHHYYDCDTGGTIRMQVRELEWHDGWPYFSDGAGES
jgi:hypothetical protein